MGINHSYYYSFTKIRVSLLRFVYYYVITYQAINYHPHYSFHMDYVNVGQILCLLICLCLYFARH